MARIGVFGMGNVLRGDDALGPYALLALAAAYVIPREVELRDLGAPGGDLTLALDGLEAAVVLDAVGEPGPPGRLCLLRQDALTVKGEPGRGLACPPRQHGPGLREALAELGALGRAPRSTVLLGLVPGTLEAGAPMSPAVKAAVPALVAAVAVELASLGVKLRPRSPPSEPSPWWERGAVA